MGTPGVGFPIQSTKAPAQTILQAAGMGGETAAGGLDPWMRNRSSLIRQNVPELRLTY
jgi:hypothetical protein